MALIRFQFCFPRTSRSDSSAEPGKNTPHSVKAGQQILELGEFDLKFTLFRYGAACKNVQYELTPVDDTDAEMFIQIAQLSRRKLMVANDEIDVERFDPSFHFVQLSFADVRCWMYVASILCHDFYDFPAGGMTERLQFFQCRLKMMVGMVDRFYANDQ